MKAKQSGFLVSDIKWNFTKFLVSSAHFSACGSCAHLASAYIKLLPSDLAFEKVHVGQVDREGNVVKRYGSSTTPMQIEEDIKKYL